MSEAISSFFMASPLRAPCQSRSERSSPPRGRAAEGCCGGGKSSHPPRRGGFARPHASPRLSDVLRRPSSGVRRSATCGRYPATPFPRFSLPPRSGRPLVSCRISSKIFFNMTGKATFFKCAAISNCYLTSSFPPASGVPLPRPCPRRASSCRGSRRAAPDGLFRPPLPAFSQRIGAPFASLPHKKAAGTGRSKKGGPDRLRS